MSSLHGTPKLMRVGLLSLLSLGLSLFSFQAEAWAWSGALTGGLSARTGEVAVEPSGGAPVDGAGRVSDEDGLSFFATARAEDGGLALLSVRVAPERVGEQLSLPGEGRLVSYQERDVEGRLIISASAYRGRLSTQRLPSGEVRVSFEVSVRQGEMTRSVASDDLVLSPLSEDADDSAEVLIHGGDVLITAAEPDNSGCDWGTEGEDVYTTDDDVSCDSSEDTWDDEWDDSSDNSYEDNSSDSSSSCDDDDWAAEARPRDVSPLKKTRRAHKSGVVTRLLRLMPLLTSLLVVALWRRRFRVSLNR